MDLHRTKPIKKLKIEIHIMAKRTCLKLSLVLKNAVAHMGFTYSGRKVFI